MMVALTNPFERPMELPLSNTDVAQKLDLLADILESQNVNNFRVKAYRTAANTIRHLKEQVSTLVDQEGTQGLITLPGVGQSLARTISQLVKTGRHQLIERSRNEDVAESILSTIPGIGSVTASRLHAELGIETLADLQAAAFDGRLASFSGFGSKRMRAVRACLARRSTTVDRVTTRPPQIEVNEPTVSELLDVDEEYRNKAEQDRLVRVAPRRFNLAGQAWLPVLRTRRGQRRYTVMYSNTARAHELCATRDWVIVSCDDHEGKGQWTVITSRFGRLNGRRIVRGRENECEVYYQNHPVLKGRFFDESP